MVTLVIACRDAQVGGSRDHSEAVTLGAALRDGVVGQGIVDRPDLEVLKTTGIEEKQRGDAAQTSC